MAQLVEFKKGTHVSLPGSQRQFFGVVSGFDRWGRIDVDWPDGSGGNYWPDQLVKPECGPHQTRKE